MIRANRASFVVHHDVETVAGITRMLGCEPDDAGADGELRDPPESGPTAGRRAARGEATFWSISESDEGETDDRTGFAAMRRLVARVRPLASAIPELRHGGDVRVLWRGQSDSGQGGFVLPADLLSELAAIACDLRGTAYLSERDDGDIVVAPCGATDGMIGRSRASLVIHHDVETVAGITAMFGCEPDDSGDIGELTPSGRAGSDLAPERLRYQHTFWCIDEQDDGESADRTGFAALRALADRLLPHAEALAALRAHGELRIWWSGDADGPQGTFVMPVQLLADLAALGCDLWGTAYLDDDGDGDGDDVVEG